GGDVLDPQARRGLADLTVDLELLVLLALHPRGDQALARVDPQRVHAGLELDLLELVGLEREPLGAAAGGHERERGEQPARAADRSVGALAWGRSGERSAHRKGL